MKDEPRLETIVLVGDFPDFDALPLIMKKKLLGIRLVNHNAGL